MSAFSPTVSACPECSGNGVVSSLETVRCRGCGGPGKVLGSRCVMCLGSGQELYELQSMCPKCRGTGRTITFASGSDVPGAATIERHREQVGSIPSAPISS
jgi:DnaJ-class molecular chaperone